MYEKISKCDFWLSQVAFLGHIITQEGVSVDPTKIKAMLKLLVVLRSEAFLGHKGCYRRFVEELSIVAQLTKLTQKGIPFRWSDDYECRLGELNRRSTIAPVLALASRSVYWRIGLCFNVK